VAEVWISNASPIIALSQIRIAKRRGMVAVAAPVFRALDEAGLFLSKALIREVLADLGETP
jgi:hypothetical protein